MGITVVTGEPRSGTSLMMSVLKKIGLDVIGEKFPGKEKKSEKRNERAKYLNPEGFWEVSGLVGRGANQKDIINSLHGKTVKLICRAMLGTPREVIDKMDKVIFCSRNPKEVMQSQTKLVSSVMGASQDDWRYAPEVSKIDYSNYKISVGKYILAADEAGLWERTLVVDYHDMLFDTKNQIKRICNFLKIPYEIEVLYYKDGEIVEKFINNIDESSKLIKSDLYRSRMVHEHDKLAFDLYKSLKTKKFDKIKKSVKSFMEKLSLKKKTWLDDTEFKTWTISGWNLHKSLITNNKGVRDKLQETARIKSTPIRDCIYYNPTGKEYTIRRVQELTDITRTKIKCDEYIYFTEPDFPEFIGKRPNGEVTRETCYNHWQNKMIRKSFNKYV